MYRMCGESQRDFEARVAAHKAAEAKVAATFEAIDALELPEDPEEDRLTLEEVFGQPEQDGIVMLVADADRVPA